MPSPRVRKTRRRLRNQPSVVVPTPVPTAKVKDPIKKERKPKPQAKKDNAPKKSD